MHICLDRTANTHCLVASTAYNEPNFVSFLHKHKGIVVCCVNLLNLCSRTASLISMLKKSALHGHQNHTLSYVPQYFEKISLLHTKYTPCGNGAARAWQARVYVLALRGHLSSKMNSEFGRSVLVVFLKHTKR